MKRHRLKCQNGFAGVIHRFDLVFEPARRAHCPELTIGVDQDGYSVGISGCHPADARDKGPELAQTDAHGIGLASNTTKKIADNDIAIARSEISTGEGAECDVTAAGVVKERAKTNGHVVGAGYIVKKCAGAYCDVLVACRVVKERLLTGGDVDVAGGVTLKRKNTGGRVEVARGVIQQRLESIGRVAEAARIAKERCGPRGRVLGAGRVGKERLIANGRVEVAHVVGKKCRTTDGRIAAALCVERER